MNPAAPESRATIVVPIHDGASMTKQCLDELLADRRGPEIVVVDDASNDETEFLLETYADRFRVIRNPQNLGFARSCNLGAASATTEFLIFLNNDTIPQPGWLEALVRHADLHPEAAVIGCKLLYPDGTIQHAGVTFTQDGRPYHLYKGFPSGHPAVSHSRKLQAVTAACVLVRRSVFEELGGFDESYLNSYEDLDLCMRVGILGHDVRYCPDAVLTHLESATRDPNGASESSNQALWLKRWSDALQRDSLQLMAEDGLIDVTLGPANRHLISIDPVAGSVVPSEDSELELAIDRATVRWLTALSVRDDPTAPRRPTHAVRFEFDATGRAISARNPDDWEHPISKSAIPNVRRFAERIAPLTLRLSRTAPPRINVLYDGLDERTGFGRDAAIFQLAAQLTCDGRHVRLVAVAASGPPNPSRWQEASHLNGASHLEQVEHIDATDRSVPIKVGATDTWVATSWSTMHVATRATEDIAGPPPLWLQQDYEPLQYPGGSFRAAAEAAYALPHAALISSDMLRRYFETYRIGVFASSDPRWIAFDNPLLYGAPPTLEELDRSRRAILIRLTEVPRHLMEITWSALDLADRRGWLPPDWGVTCIGGPTAAGEMFDLSSGRKVGIRGRAPTEQYAELLRAHDVGVALEDSPHPGLMTLDLAASSLMVVTTTFAHSKRPDDLSSLSRNIIGVPPSSEAVAAAILTAVERSANLEARLAGANFAWPRSAAEAFTPDLVARVHALLGT